LQSKVVDRGDKGDKGDKEDKGDKGDKEDKEDKKEKVVSTLAKRLCRSNATSYKAEWSTGDGGWGAFILFLEDAIYMGVSL
jgi:hypothetical protein